MCCLCKENLSGVSLGEPLTLSDLKSGYKTWVKEHLFNDNFLSKG